ncbi:MAG TPA: protein kinase [Polyangia bacterium]|nr:protein kinase [Polyangia bacterium]
MRPCPTCGAPLAPGLSRCPADGTLVDPLAETALPDASGPNTRAERRPAAPEPTPAAAAPAHPLLGRVIDGRYRILRPLGAGGMGAVYLAEHAQIHKTVAVKVLQSDLARDPEFRQRFEHEARAASRLTHLSCVSVIDFGCVAQVEPPEGGTSLLGALYLVMEYVRGETLADRLKRSRLDPTEAIVLTRGVLSALRHAHGLGLVHRDLKPHNIMLCADDDGTRPLVKLLDFGLAKQVEGHAHGQPVTRTGVVYGTPAYLSPEQAVGEPMDARSDVYSLGAVLYEMVCGKTPFHKLEDTGALMRAHIVLPPPPPRDLNPHISPELEAVILKALAKEPAARHASAEEFQAALAACPEARGKTPTPLAAVPARATPTPSASPAPLETPQAPAKRPSRRPLLFAFGGGLLAALVAAAVLWHTHKPPAPVAATPAPQPAEPPPDPPSPSAKAEYALTLVDRGHSEDAILTARAALQRKPHDGLARMALGIAYQSKLWCSDAIDEFQKAVRDTPALSSDPRLLRAAIACLQSKAQYRAVRFLGDLGAPAVAALKEAAKDPNPDVRQGAERALARIEQKP